MGPAPLPPHERHWRHPSELSPTIADVDAATTGRGLILATGAAAALLAVVMVVALTPPRSSAPTAIGATTIPSATILLQNTPQDVARSAGQDVAVTLPQTISRPGSQIGAPSGDAERLSAPGSVRIERNMISRDNSLTLIGAPNAVSAAPEADADDMSLAGSLPTNAERVMVLTLSHTYDVAWRQIERIDAPDGSIVMTRDGELIATFVDGELRLLVS